MNLNEPAMPLLGETNGLSLREYAAIHLCIPDSGNDELDAMIKRAQRERLAGQIIASMVSIDPTEAKQFGDPKGRKYSAWMTADALDVADAVIAAGEVEK